MQRAERFTWSEAFKAVTVHLDLFILDPEIVDTIENKKSVEKKLKIFNVEQSVDGRVCGAIAKKYGDTGFAGEIKFLFEGSAGESFGCFLTLGLYLCLVGETNDYVGKGMAGGKIVISPPVGLGFKAEDATIVGNTCLYGATGGQLFANEHTFR